MLAIRPFKSWRSSRSREREIRTWSSDAELEAAISSAVRLHPHRADVYRRAGGAWHAFPLAKEPADYEEKVEAESRQPLGSSEPVVSSAAMSLHDQIQSLVARFAGDLEGLVRSAAVSAVEAALGPPSVGRAASGSIATLASKRGLKPRAAAPATVAATVGKPRKATRVRRTPEQIQATANKIHAFVRANPHTGVDAVRKALSINRTEWIVSLRLLMGAKRLSSKGQKRATTYTAR